MPRRLRSWSQKKRSVFRRSSEGSSIRLSNSPTLTTRRIWRNSVKVRFAHLNEGATEQSRPFVYPPLQEKHQITSTCLRRSGFAQAGQITNRFQWSKFQTEEKAFWSFGIEI